MNLVTVKCPACSASLQLNKGMSEYFCSYCGSKITVRQASTNVKIDKSQDLENLIYLAESALNGNNGLEAYEYANKALEIDPTNPNIWLLKMYALDIIGTLEDIRAEEIITCGSNAIAFSNDNVIKNVVYKLYIDKANAILKLCIELISDTEEIKEIHRDLWAYDFSTAKEETYKIDTPFFTLVDNCAMKAIILKEAIPFEYISNYIQEIKRVAEQYVFYNECVGKRFSIYGFSFLDEVMHERTRIVNRLKKGLPEKEQQGIHNISIKKEGIDGVKVFTVIGVIIIVIILIMAQLS